MLNLMYLVQDKAHDVMTEINDMPYGHKIKILVYDNQSDFVRYCLKEDSKLKLYSVHMTMFARVLFEIPDKVSLIRFNREKYENWLDDKKLTDSKGSLSMWTASI